MTATPAPPRSTFVTAVAWLFIALAGFSTLVSLLQNLMVTFLFPADMLEQVGLQGKNAPRIPPVAEFLLQNFRGLVFAMLLVTLAMLTASIGLLLRRNWARLLFVALLGLGIAWNIGGLAIAYAFFSEMMQVPVNAPKDFADGFELMSKVMMVFQVLVAVGISALLGWIMKKLLSDEIRAEFS
jgi:hypothetical protein